MTSDDITPNYQRSDENVPFHIRHYSQSAPHQREADQILEDYFQKKCEPITADRLKESQNADPDEETHNGSCSFFVPRTYSESHFFDLTPGKLVKK